VRAPARMVNPIQHYPWGSRTAIARLQGREPSGRPEAELWMGAHPSAPSHVDVGEKRFSLLEVIERAPEEVLGVAVTDRFGPRLPFLLKLLAADRPLSLQAHPSQAQAVQGFHAEQARGVPIDARERNYRDTSAKPELLCALTPVDALCGFRDTATTIELLERLRAPRLQPLVDTLRGDPPEVAMPAVVERVLTWPPRDRCDLVAEVSTGAKRIEAEPDGFAPEAAWVQRLAELHPCDPGVVAALLLNLVRLRPGQALYLPSGNLHAYLGGFGVEVMANSDNVLRGGLTPKHVDVPELQRVLDHSAGPTSQVPPRAVSEHEVTYCTPAPNFRLSRHRLAPDTDAELTAHGPQVLLCVEGQVTVSHPASTSTLGRGESLFVPAAAGTTALRGAGVVFRASVPGTTVGD